jgi:hypothetical protein
MLHGVLRKLSFTQAKISGALASVWSLSCTLSLPWPFALSNSHDAALHIEICTAKFLI